MSVSLRFRQEWFTVYEHNRRPSCTVSDLVMGNEYSFRVFSENICGLSDEAGVSRNTAFIAKTGEEVPACSNKKEELKTLFGVNPSLGLQVWLITPRPSKRRTSAAPPSSQRPWWTGVWLQVIPPPSAVQCAGIPRYQILPTPTVEPI